ncbi:MAG: tRNA-dihydrouridine synthase family protein [Clostridia bacterium]|nr:tRNA-dihydrouridine synthase family protein [Clostridia bacterium]
MPMYFAPMEGLTDDIFRRTHSACFAGVNKYFIPFVAPTQHCVFMPKERTALLPENNRGLYAVPQVLTKNVEYFLWAAREIADMGYAEVNLNIGCPSPTVTTKGKGSGMLKDPENLQYFLDDIFSRSPLPISVKTRIGYDTPDEWPRLLEILKNYPMLECIIHPRTRSEQYKGDVHPDAFDLAAQIMSCPLCYNGNLFTAEDFRRVRARYPHVSLMAGRGAMTNPALFQEAAGGEKLSVPALRRFIDMLQQGYAARYDESVIVGRMRDNLKMIAQGFEDNKKPLKAICKARTIDAQNAAIEQLLSHDLKETPAFTGI